MNFTPSLASSPVIADFQLHRRPGIGSNRLLLVNDDNLLTLHDVNTLFLEQRYGLAIPELPVMQEG